MDYNQTPKFKTKTKQDFSNRKSILSFLNTLSNNTLAIILAGTVVIGGITGYATTILLSGNSKEINQQDTTTKNGDSNTVGYKVIKEDVPQFDDEPIPYKNEGWIARENGKYGFINKDGKWEIEPTFEALSFNFFKEERVCAFPTVSNFASDTEGEDFDAFVFDGVSESCRHTGLGGLSPYHWVYDNGKLQIEESSGQEGTAPSSPDTSIIIRDRDVVASDDYQTAPYYIWNKGNEKIYGPYDSTEYPGFSTYPHVGLEAPKNERNIEVQMNYLPNTEVSGLIWAKEGDKYRIVRADDQESKDLYDEVRSIYMDSILVKKGNQWGILDENLDFIDLQDTSVESITKPIDGKCYIKKDGKWMLVEVGTETSSAEQPEEEKETEVAIEEQEEEVEEETMEDEFAEEEASGRKVLTGTVRKIYDRATLVELSGAQQDPNPHIEGPDTDCLIILDEPQYIPISDSVGGINSNNEIKMFSVQGANIPDSYDGQRIVFSYDPNTASLAQDTSLPMHQPRTTDIKILETLQ